MQTTILYEHGALPQLAMSLGLSECRGSIHPQGLPYRCTVDFVAHDLRTAGYQTVIDEDRMYIATNKPELMRASAPIHDILKEYYEVSWKFVMEGGVEYAFMAVNLPGPGSPQAIMETTQSSDLGPYRDDDAMGGVIKPPTFKVHFKKLASLGFNVTSDEDGVVVAWPCADYVNHPRHPELAQLQSMVKHPLTTWVYDTDQTAWLLKLKPQGVEVPKGTWRSKATAKAVGESLVTRLRESGLAHAELRGQYVYIEAAYTGDDFKRVEEALPTSVRRVGKWSIAESSTDPEWNCFKGLVDCRFGSS